MAKTYKILVNDGKGTDIQPVRVMQGGEPVRMLAKRGWRFELQDDIKGKSLAPDQVRIKRVGKNLTLMFDGSQRADVVIEDFYAENTDKDKDNGSPKLVGTAENGGMYEYVPQDPAVSSMPAELKDGNTPVIVALGGGPLEGDFVLAGLPLVAAAGGISGWAVARGAAAAAAAGGGGGGGGAAVVVPSKATGLLTHDVVNDTGVSNQDSITKNQNPTYSGVADKGATVEVTVNGVVYTTTASTKDGSYSIPLTNNGKPLDDGVYTPSIKVSNATGGTITSDGAPFTIDHTTDKNQDATKSPTTVVDDNSGVPVAIVSIDSDTGSAATDFITSDGSLTFSGTVTGFKANGDVVHVQVVKADGSVVVNQYVTPDSQGVWSINHQTQTLATGDYTIKASIEDLAGNVVEAAVDQPLTIAGADVLVARNDTAVVIENQVITSAASISVLVNDGDTTAARISVNSVQGLPSNVGAIVQGKYGQLQLFADGHYVYTETDNSLPAGVHETDTFTYEVQAVGPTRTATATLSIDITGTNDSATVALHSRKPVIALGEGADKYASNGNSDPLSVVDDDQRQAAILGISQLLSTTSYGVYYDLVVEKNTNGSYDWSYNHANKSPAPASTELRTVHDLFSFTSVDGTANATLDLEIATPNATKQEFNVRPVGTSHIVQGLEAIGKTETADTLVLRGSDSESQQTTFDFSDPTITKFTSIEKIDLKGQGLNTLKLCLTDLIQGEVSTSANPHQLFITGDANDTVDFHSLTSSNTAVSHDATSRQVNGSDYWVYRIGHDELLVQTTIANIAVYI